MNEQRAAELSSVAIQVHVIRRARELTHQAPGARLPPDVAQLHNSAAERLRSMTGLELVDALIEYRRVTGVPFKL